MTERREIPIRGDTIRLGQLLKLAGVIDSGGEFHDLVESDELLVNGEPESRRGRQLHHGDVVALTDIALEVLASDAPSH